MFTGIVQGLAVVKDVTGDSESKHFVIQFPSKALNNITKGASIALNGTCLTVTQFSSKQDIAEFDVIGETLDKTNLGTLTVGDNVNFERAAKIGDEIGGHLMSGHIHTTVALKERVETNQNTTLRFEMPDNYRDYLLEKGFVGLNGCSLTLGTISNDTFEVYLIPETLGVTTFGEMSEGSLVNIEIDPQTQAIVDTVNKVMAKNNG